MAKLNPQRSGRLPSATLVEATTAMVIASMVFMLSVAIGLKTMAWSHTHHAKAMAKIVLQSKAEELKEDLRYGTETIKTRQYHINVAVSPYKGQERVALLALAALKSGKIIAKHHEIIYLPPKVAKKGGRLHHPRTPLIPIDQ